MENESRVGKTEGELQQESFEKLLDSAVQAGDEIGGGVRQRLRRGVRAAEAALNDELDIKDEALLVPVLDRYASSLRDSVTDDDSALKERALYLGLMQKLAPGEPVRDDAKALAKNLDALSKGAALEASVKVLLKDLKETGGYDYLRKNDPEKAYAFLNKAINGAIDDLNEIEKEYEENEENDTIYDPGKHDEGISEAHFGLRRLYIMREKLAAKLPEEEPVIEAADMGEVKKLAKELRTSADVNEFMTPDVQLALGNHFMEELEKRLDQAEKQFEEKGLKLRMKTVGQMFGFAANSLMPQIVASHVMGRIVKMNAYKDMPAEDFFSKGLGVNWPPSAEQKVRMEKYTNGLS
jgi:hypothetical protein